MMLDDLAITIGFTIAGIIATWFFARQYYRKGSKDIEGLESLQHATISIVRDENPQEGKLTKGEDGRWRVDWARTLQEKVTFTDSVSVVKNPGTGREERIQ